MNKLFGYPGGKWPIRKVVISAFPPHKTYVDVFGGSAALIIAKEKSDGEVYNDKSEELANFFRVVKHRPAELAERAKREAGLKPKPAQATLRYRITRKKD